MIASGMQTVMYPVTDLASAQKVDPNGHKQGMSASVPYWHVDDIKASLQKLVAAGATVQQQPSDIGGGDADGREQPPIGIARENFRRTTHRAGGDLRRLAVVHAQ